MNSLQSQFVLRHSLSKSSQSTPNRSNIINWINEILPSCNLKAIEQLGDGQIYCRIVNHYVPNTILQNRIIDHPRNQYEYCLNLKQFQLSLAKLKINIPFDISKVSRRNFNQNWTLVSLFYKQVHSQFHETQFDADSVKTSGQEIRLANQNRKSDQNCAKKIQKLTSSSKITLLSENSDNLSLIDRTKEILLSSSNNTEKIRQIRKLYGLQEVKVEEDLQMISPYIFYSK